MHFFLKGLILAITSLFFVHALPGQNWLPFQKEKHYFYHASTGNQDNQSIQVDSVKIVGSDTVYFMSPVAGPLDTNYTCQIEPWEFPDKSYWFDNLMGRKVIDQGNGKFLFVYSSGDTFLIKTLEPPGSTWNFSQGLTAQVGLRTDTALLGVQDSLIRIDVSNGASISILKDHGIFSFNDILFPAMAYTLAFLPRRINIFDFYDFDVGDRMTFYSSTQIFSSYDSHHEQFTVLSKTVSGSADTIVYTMDRKSKVYVFPDPTCSRDTVTWTITEEPGTFLNMVKGHFFTEDQSVTFGEGQLISDESDSVALYGNRLSFSTVKLGNDTCNKLLYYNQDGGNAQEFTLGLGQTFDGVFGIWVNEYYLVCYRKASDSAGVCPNLDCLDAILPSSAQKQELTCFPNPASDEITIGWSDLENGKYSLEVLNIHGVTVVNMNDRYFNENGKIKISLEGLSNGIYLVRINGPDSAFHSTFIKN